MLLNKEKLKMKKVFKNRNLTEICAEINNVIHTSGEKSKKIEYNDLMTDFYRTLFNSFDYKQIDDLCNITVKIAKTKNRVIRYIEKDIWRDLPDLPLKLIQYSDFEIAEDEVLMPESENENEIKKILSRLLKLSYDILELEDDRSKSSEIRRAGALEIIAEINNFYVVTDSKLTFIKSINSSNTKEQYSALTGLDNYYRTTDDEIDEKLLKNLNLIIKETDDRTVASVCLQIQINAGLIDELSAVFSIDSAKTDIIRKFDKV